MAQRKLIATELKGRFKELAESKYGKFLVAKVIVEGDDDIRAMVIPEFYGSVRKLINHPEASWILDDIYRQVATKQQKARLLREWYGPEFALFRSDAAEDVTADLSKIIKESPEKRIPIQSYLLERINQLVQKKMTGFTMLHDAMLQYFLTIEPGTEEFNDFLSLLIGDNKEEEVDLLKNLAFTKSGSELVCLALAHASSKERRRVLRSYKDTVELLAYDIHGHRILLTLFEVMDDTREIAQRIYNELVLLTNGARPEDQDEKIVNLATHHTGHSILLYPFAGGPSRKVLHPVTFNFMKRIEEIRKKTSKKDPQIRMSELVAPLSPVCLHAIEARANDLASSSYGCQLMTEVIVEGTGDKSIAVSAVAKTAEGDVSEAGHISHSPFAGKMLKTLIAGGRFDSKSGRIVLLDPPINFDQLLIEVIGDDLKAWTLGDGGFVVMALIANGKNEPIRNKVLGWKKDLQAQLNAGAKVEKDADKPEDKDARRRAMAAKLLLEELDKSK
jgi:pumilio family protein 6